METHIVDLSFRGITPKFASELEQTRIWPHALVVPEMSLAEDVAKIVDLNDFNLVISIGAANQVSGVLFPNQVIIRAVKNLSLPASSYTFSQAVEIISGLRTPRKTGFEWLNSERPVWYWCNRGKHRTSEKNCSQHPPV